jgi:uncharacterized protein (TIGR00297 family)
VIVFLIGAILAAIIAFAALIVGALTFDGALAAFIVGTCTFGAGRIPGAAILLAFFITAVFLTRLRRERKRALESVTKGGPRNALQVFANGGVATICILFAAHGDHAWLVAFAGAYAAATADTWGTEIGTLAKDRPRALFDWRAEVPTGISGGISAIGTIAEIAGAFFITWVAGQFGIVTDARQAALVLFAGVAGAVVDSILGATVQAQRWCPECATACENDPHVCGTETVLRRGQPWMTNDAVNFAATATGAFVAFAFAG